MALLDLDLGSANLHTFVGINSPDESLDGYIHKRLPSLKAGLLPTEIPNLSLISSVGCSLEIANLFHAQKVKIMRAIQGLPHDYILLDLGSGTHFNTLDFFLLADEGLFITTPETTAIENTFRFIQCVYYRTFRHSLTKAGMWNLCRQEIGDLAAGKIKYPSELINNMLKKHPDRARVLQKSLDNMKFNIIVNKRRQQDNTKLGQQLATVCNRHFYPNFSCLGSVSYDNKVRDATNKKALFIERYPYTNTAIDIINIADNIKKTKNNIDNNQCFHETV